MKKLNINLDETHVDETTVFEYSGQETIRRQGFEHYDELTLTVDGHHFDMSAVQAACREWLDKP